MDTGTTIFVTVVTTILGGVLLFIASEILKEIWLEPLQQYKKLKSQIVYSLNFHANKWSSPVPNEYVSSYPEYQAASIEFRELSSQTVAFTQLGMIRWRIPKFEELDEASRMLMGISNGFFTTEEAIDSQRDHNYELDRRIRELLKIKVGKEK